MTRLVRASGEKPLFWVASSQEDLQQFAEPVKDAIGVALSVAQFGGKHPAAKPLEGSRAGRSGDC
jgi:phage-related protein